MKLDEKKARKIRDRHSNGISIARLAADYSVSESSIRKVIRGNTFPEANYNPEQRIVLSTYIDEMLSLKRARMTNTEVGRQLARRHGRSRPFSEGTVRRAWMEHLEKRCEDYDEQRDILKRGGL